MKYTEAKRFTVHLLCSLVLVAMIGVQTAIVYGVHKTIKNRTGWKCVGGGG